MRVLHLISDWKWTGAAEPTVSSCEALMNEGIDLCIAFQRPPFEFSERTIEKEVSRRGIPVVKGLNLERRFSFRFWIADTYRLKRIIEKEGFDIIHSHLSHDHFLAFFSKILCKEKPVLIRTDHSRDGLKKDPFTGIIVRKTDGIVSYSRKFKDRIVSQFGLSEKKVCVVPPGLKLEMEELKDVRPLLGIEPHEKLIGVVGRLKADRNYDLILKAFRKVSEVCSLSKLVILGRSSQIQKSVIEPIRKLGIGDRVIIAGYRIGDYYSYISAFDLFVMMRAGSDGTARALREVMALGKPVIVGDTGMLGELVMDGETGFVVPLDENVLAQRILILLQNEELRRTMGKNAKAYARSFWSYETQAKILKNFYLQLLESRAEK